MAINDEICNALHRAFDRGYVAGRLAEKIKKEDNE